MTEEKIEAEETPKEETLQSVLGKQVVDNFLKGKVTIVEK